MTVATAIELLVVAGQTIGVCLILFGLPLLFKPVRDAITKAYADSAIDKARHLGVDRARALSLAIASRMLFSRNGCPSLRKTFVIALFDVLLIALPVTLVVHGFATGTTDQNGNMVLTDAGILVWPALVAALLSHWLLEYLLARLLHLLLTKTPALPFSRIVVCMLVGLVVACVVPLVIALLILFALARLGSGFFFPALGIVFSGPVLLGWSLMAGSLATNLSFWLALASSLSFSVGVLVVVFTFVVLRVRATNALLALLSRWLGAGTGVAMVAFGVGLFGFLTDFASSHVAIRKVLGLP